MIAVWIDDGRLTVSDVRECDVEDLVLDGHYTFCQVPAGGSVTVETRELLLIEGSPVVPIVRDGRCVGYKCGDHLA